MKHICITCIMLICSCKNGKEAATERQQAISKEMKLANSFYFQQIDSLDAIKKVDTSAAKLAEIAAAIRLTDEQRSATLLRLQTEYDSLGNLVR